MLRIPLLIFTLSTRRRRVINCTFRPLYPWGSNLVPTKQGVLWARQPVWTFCRRATSLSQTRTRTLDRPVRISSTGHKTFKSSVKWLIIFHRVSQTLCRKPSTKQPFTLLATCILTSSKSAPVKSYALSTVRFPNYCFTCDAFNNGDTYSLCVLHPTGLCGDNSLTTQKQHKNLTMK